MLPLLECGQFHPRKIPPERHVHREKLGRFPQHRHAHEIFLVESQYHCAQIEYQPNH